jgi:hypothetical protein
MVDALLPSRLRHRHWCAAPPQLAAMVSGWAGGCGLLRLQCDCGSMLQLRQPVLRLSDLSCCLQAQSNLRSHAAAMLRMPAGSAAACCNAGATSSTVLQTSACNARRASDKRRSAVIRASWSRGQAGFVNRSYPAGLPVAGVGRRGDVVQILLALQQRRLLACQPLLSDLRVALSLQKQVQL